MGRKMPRHTGKRLREMEEGSDAKRQNNGPGRTLVAIVEGELKQLTTARDVAQVTRVEIGGRNPGKTY